MEPSADDGDSDSLTVDFVCENCGFRRPNVFRMGRGSSMQNMTLIIECDQCDHEMKMAGSMAATQINGRLQLVFGGMSAEQLRSVQNSLQQALRQGVATVDAVADTLEEAAPSLAQWVRTFADKNMGVVTLLGFLFVVVEALLKGWASDAPPPPPAQITQINQNIEFIERGGQAEPIYPRRQPCPCGNGERFKNCHGRYPGAGGAVDPKPSGWSSG